ncbi:MAG TPA: hypothetical protein VGD09_14230 [Blastococcus sp.]
MRTPPTRYVVPARRGGHEGAVPADHRFLDAAEEVPVLVVLVPPDSPEG